MMTDVIPYQATQLAGRDTVDGWASMLGMSRELANFIASSEGFVPGTMRGKPAAVVACILSGRELGIGPMASLQHLHVIDGRPAMSAQMMRALVQAHGHELDIREWDTRHCVIWARRAGSERWQGVTYTWADAERARLDRKPVWQAYPDAMLLARATAKLCRAMFADVLGGMAYASEELEDMAGGERQTLPVSQELPAGATVVQREQPPEQPQAGPDAPPSAQPVAPEDEPLTAEPLLPLDTRRSREATRAAALPRARAERAGASATPRTDETMSELRHQSGGDPATVEQQRHVFALLNELGRSDTREQRMRVAQGLLSRRVTSFQELNVSEASALIDTLVRARESDEPGEYLDWLVDQGMDALEMLESGNATQDADVVDFPEPQGDEPA